VRVAKPPIEALSAKREVIVVLRLLIGPDGRIVHGYIVDPGQRTAGPFRLQGLAGALRDWIRTEPGVAQQAAELDRRG
jgi:hypothetical protein